MWSGSKGHLFPGTLSAGPSDEKGSSKSFGEKDLFVSGMFFLYTLNNLIGLRKV